MTEEINLWEKVGTGCLNKALELLEDETAPTAATVETVKRLMEAAVSDMASFDKLPSAAFLRHEIKQKRKARGLSTDLRSLIAEYHSVCPEYADSLEQVIYPAPKIAKEVKDDADPQSDGQYPPLLF